MTFPQIDAAKRTILLFATAQALYSSCTIIVFATAGLVGLTIAPSKSLSTFPLTSFVVGSMLATIPISFLMQRFGRKPVFICGSAIALVGALLATYAIVHSQFWLFCLATAMFGVFQASAGFYGFAASEAAGAENKAVAISWVLTGGVVAAVAGTLIASAAADAMAPFTFAGSYAAAAVLAILSMVVIAFAHLPKPSHLEVGGPQRSWPELLQQPRLLLAMISAMTSYAMMTLMMTAAPVAMAFCGFDQHASSWVIQWHVLAMFVPSFFTGLVIKRYGVVNITMLGMMILITSGVAGVLGISFAHYAVALVLLGLGWNFGFIGGTTMLTECYTPAERAKVQGANNFGVSALMAVASFGSGQLLNGLGWSSIDVMVIAVAALMMATLFIRRTKATA